MNHSKAMLELDQSYNNHVVKWKSKSQQRNFAIFQSINFIVSFTHNNAHNTYIQIPIKRSFQKIRSISAFYLAFLPFQTFTSVKI